MKRKRASPAEYDPFAVDQRVTDAFGGFLKSASMNPRKLRDWLQPYLNWRWQMRERYTALGHVQRASGKERELLITYNDWLIRDAERLHSDSSTHWLMKRINPIARIRSQLVARLEDEALQVLNQARSAKPVAPALHALFDGFVHDSLAGFDHAAVEWTGYWRYRRGFLGNDKSIS